MDMRVMTKWGWADHYGKVDNWSIHWEKTTKDAQKWIEFMTKRNGQYFQVKETKEADYTKYLRILELEKELETLKAEF